MGGGGSIQTNEKKLLKSGGEGGGKHLDSISNNPKDALPNYCPSLQFYGVSAPPIHRSSTSNILVIIE